MDFENESSEDAELDFFQELYSGISNMFQDAEDEIK
jgi:hypothetical protein